MFVHVQYLSSICPCPTFVQSLSSWLWARAGHGQTMDLCVQGLDLCVQSMDLCVQSLDFCIQSLDFGIQSLDLGVQSLDRPCTLADVIGQILDLAVQSLDLKVQSLDRFCTLGNVGQSVDRHWTKVGQSLDFDVQSLDLAVQSLDLGVQGPNSIRSETAAIFTTAVVGFPFPVATSNPYPMARE